MCYASPHQTQGNSPMTESEQSSLISTKKEQPGFDVARWMLLARDKFGKSLASQVRELASLTRGRGRLPVKSYYTYRLFDDERFTPELKRTYVGIDFSGEIISKLGDSWHEFASDKPTLTLLLRGSGLPIPETQALVHPVQTFLGSERIRSSEELGDFLRKRAVYPVFTKPTDSVSSLGAASIDNYDASDDTLCLADGRKVPVGEYLEGVEPYIASGYLVQSRMAPHPELAEFLGPKRLGTCRMFVFVDEEGPVLWRASWRIPTGTSVADNFWRGGNLLAGLDPETGDLIRVVQGLAKEFEPIEAHPDSHCEFAGKRFPEWQAMRDTVLRAASAIPKCRLQGWDVALTDKGPVLVECEGNGGDPIMTQLPANKGLLEGRYARFRDWVDTYAAEQKQKNKNWRLRRVQTRLGSLFESRKN